MNVFFHLNASFLIKSDQNYWEFPSPFDACLREAASAKAGGRVSLPAGRQGWGWTYQRKLETNSQISLCVRIFKELL
jgi:hypothetical protein